MEEIWKTSYIDERYAISNLGRAKRLSYSITRLSRFGNYHTFTISERILKNSVNNMGYVMYSFGNGQLLHRLMAIAFMPNPKNMPCINHKDGNKLNNDLNNLEWCTKGENNRHAYAIGIKKASPQFLLKGKYNLRSKPIVMMNKEGIKINEFENARLAVEKLAKQNIKVCYKHISDVCLGRRRHHAGYKWEYVK